MSLTGRSRQSDPADIVKGLDCPLDPHYQRFLAGFNATRPIIGVVLHETLAQIG